MRDLLRGWPTWVAFLALFAGAMARGGATYAVGRGLRVAGTRSRWSAHLDRPTMKRAEHWIGRWGASIVTLSFLTVGVQTAINAMAGALRMPWTRYVPALVVGALLWAGLYLSVGLAVIGAILGRAGWGWAVGAVALVVAIVLLSRRLRSRSEEPV